MGNAVSVDDLQGNTAKSIPEKVHDLYYKAFPEADCPVTGAAREKLVSASISQDRGTGSSEAASTSGPDEDSSSRKYKNPHAYDVYGRRIDPASSNRGWKMPSFLYYTAVRGYEEINPSNMMPKHANQAPAPGQKEVLSTNRQKSSIPKGGTEENWLYPSPQMFFNSLVRKGKADDVKEKDMDVVVYTHNLVNERTWSRLLEWEQLYDKLFPNSSVEDPRLLYFRGRDQDLTPKAQFKRLLGYGVPFDRHDWVVDRGGREMRYIIDYYYDESAEGTGKWPFFIDVRPALDSPSAILLRTRMVLDEILNKSGLPTSYARSPTSTKEDHANVDSQQSLAP